MATVATAPKREAYSGGASLWLYLLAACWLAAWVYQLIAGLRVTGLDQQIVWGLYIAGFFTAVGAGAGLVILAVLGEFYSLAPAAERSKMVCMALASFITGGVLITMDLGNPWDVWRLVFAGRFASMMTWDFWLLALVFLLAIGLAKIPLGSAYRPTVAGVAVVLAVALVVVESWMLSTWASRELWAGGHAVASFLIGAAIAGLASAVLALPRELSGDLKLGLVVALAVSFILTLAEVFAGVIGGNPHSVAETVGLLWGPLAPLFWLHLIVGLIVPMILLKNPVRLRSGAVLALLGVILEKVWLLAAGQALPLLAIPGSSYTPSLIEIIALIGVIALGALMYQWLLRWVLGTKPA